MQTTYESSSSRQQCFSEPVTPPRRNRQGPNKAQSTGSPNTKHVIPKSLSISHMMKLGKLAKPNASVSVLDIYSFDLENIAWSLLPQKVEFVIEEDVLGSGGFRQAFKARSSSTTFEQTYRLSHIPMLTLPEEGGMDNKKPLKCCNILSCAFTVNHHPSVNLLMVILLCSVSALPIPVFQECCLFRSSLHRHLQFYASLLSSRS